MRSGREFAGAIAAAVFPLLLLATAAAWAETYEVGPGKTHEKIGQAPWATLKPGDIVLIHWRPEPYREKWVICRQGTKSDPIVVRGVPGPDGQLPLVSGEDAVTAPGLKYDNEARGVLKIGSAEIPREEIARHIVVEGLEIRSGRPPYQFTGHSGRIETYSPNGAAIHVERGEHVVIRNCTLRDSGNGLFVSHGGGRTRSILIEGNCILENGIEGSTFQHNSYTEALGITFQYNRYGPQRRGAVGAGLKDRSAGLVVRYNWIEGGNRQLDLVESTSRVLLDSQAYRTTYVYGNVLIEPPNDGNSQILHYGGDGSTTDVYRKGTLYFHHNTVVSLRTDTTTLFRVSTNEERVVALNNIFYTVAPGGTLAVMYRSGKVELSHNWLKQGWKVSHDEMRGELQVDESDLKGEDPGFRSVDDKDFGLKAGSAAIGAAGPLPDEIRPSFGVTRQYVRHQKSAARPSAARPDLGAFETVPAQSDAGESSKARRRRGPR
jgi:hypothetical protein